MKLYLAGTSGSDPKKEGKNLVPLFKRGCKLHSYFHIPVLEKRWFHMNKKNKVDLFLDSGAFSAWTQNVEINIEDYIQFIKDNEDVISVYANLDVIGDPEGTLRNQRIMEKAGLKPVPVYHYGEDLKYLTLYVNEYEYIAIGGMVGKPNKALQQWLDPLWATHLTDEKGMPLCKVHGFGMTSLRLMLRYPWWSVDSTSWVVTGRLGSIYVPQMKNGKWAYDEDSWKISVSNRSPDLKQSGKHIQNLSPRERALFLQYIKEKGYTLGKSEFYKKPQTHELEEGEKWAQKKPTDKNALRLVERIIEPGVSNMYQIRDEINILYFLDLEKSMRKWPWSFGQNTVQSGFFH